MNWVKDRHAWIGVIVVCAVGAGILLLLPVLGGYGIVYYEACVKTGTISTEVLWTPLILLDSPYLGSASATSVRLESPGSSPVPGLSASLTASNGSAVGAFSLNQWTVYSQQTEFVPGAGPSAGCVASRSTVMAPSPIPLEDETTVLTVQLLGSGNTSDVLVPFSFMQLGIHSVYFAAGFQYDSDGGYGTCSGGGLGVSLGTEGIAVSVPFNLGSAFYGIVPALVPADASYSYQIPPNGTWEVDSDTSVGLAFNFTACP
ncbi:MAG: hypothetical protein WCA77_02670 [Thermoplasmata archaeon]